MEGKQAVRFIAYWVPVIAVAAAIFIVSSVPGENIPGLFTGQSIIAHFLEYFILAALLGRAVKEYFPGQKRFRRLILVFMAVVIYAALDEMHQSFVPNRCASLSDIAVDGIGGLLGGLILR